MTEFLTDLALVTGLIFFLGFAEIAYKKYTQHIKNIKDNEDFQI
jgi:hypothetical protein